MRNTSLIEQELALLRQHFNVEIVGNYDQVIICGYPLPDNWEQAKADLLLLLPGNFPQGPPKLYISNTSRLRFARSDRLGYFHSFNKTDPLWTEGWGWLCFDVSWLPAEDGVFSFLQKMDTALAQIHADRNDLA